MTDELIDFSYARFTSAEVRAAGRTGVIRYVASGRPDVSATRTEVDAYRAAGMPFAAVWQRGATRSLGGRPAGQVDAADARAYTATLGAAPDDPIYFSVDFNPTSDQYPAIAAYAQGCADVLGWPRVGVYANAPTIDYLTTRTPIALFWLHNWGSAGRVPAATTLHQYAINQTLAGKAVDFDRSLAEYWGQWGARPVSYYLLEHRNPNGDHFYTTRRKPLLAIVVHCTAGLEDLDLIGPDASAEDTARYASTTTRDVSWHSGSDSDSWVDLLPYSYTAWQCVDYNSSTAGHEISKLDMVWADEPAEWTTRTLRMAAVGPDGRTGLAKRARDNGIPLRHCTRTELDAAIAAGGPPVGFIGHRELDPDRRTDPGADFPWTRFLGLMANPQGDNDMDVSEFRREIGATDGKSTRTALWELSTRAVNAALGKGTTRADIDTTDIGGGSPARVGVDDLIEGSTTLQEIRDAQAEQADQLARIQELLETLTAAPAEPTA